MRQLLATALVGTARAGSSSPATDTAIDALIAELPGSDVERLLLLAAGSAAVYRAAGYVPETVSEVPVPAPDDEVSVCSPRAAELLRAVFAGRNHNLVREALGRLGRAGLRLPPDLLPVALDRCEPGVRATLVPVLGERGRWLAGFNTAWSWVNDYLPAADAPLPADVDMLWEEGMAGQRSAILRRVRAVDPERGRRWLQAVWKQEKADVRAELLGALAVGLGPDDEAVLESALDDRAHGVRATAASLLATLPTSALVARMTARADAMLSYSAATLDARPPTALEPDAARDGISARPAHTFAGGERAWWLMQILSHVPPAHWLARFSVSPETLIAAAAGTSWRAAILEGWTHAAVTSQDRDWALALWHVWGIPQPRRKDAPGVRDGDELRAELAPLLPADELERQALGALGEAATLIEVRLDDILAGLPVPWSSAIGEAYLRSLRAFAGWLDTQSRDGAPFQDTLARAALALPPDCLASAAEPIPTPEDNSFWPFRQFRSQLDAFADTVQVRRRIVEEIPL